MRVVALDFVGRDDSDHTEENDGNDDGNAVARIGIIIVGGARYAWMGDASKRCQITSWQQDIRTADVKLTTAAFEGEGSHFLIVRPALVNNADKFIFKGVSREAFREGREREERDG